MPAPTAPENRVILGSEVTLWRIPYSEFSAYVSQPHLDLDASLAPDLTTYPNAVQIAKLSVDDYESTGGSAVITKETHAIGKIKFPGKEMMDMVLRNIDVMDPNFLDFFPGITVVEDSTSIQIRPSRKLGITDHVLVAIVPQPSNCYYEVMYKPSGEGTMKTKINAQGNSIVQYELKLDGLHVRSRAAGDRVGFCEKIW